MEIDRPSNLSERIIYHILFFMDTKQAVQTSVMSKIWRHHWTHIYNLNLECVNNRITRFKKFVPDVLHHHKPFNLNGLRSLKHSRDEDFVCTANKNVKIAITAPRLKFFNLKDIDSLELSMVLSMVDFPALEKVDIHNSQLVCLEVDDKKKEYILDSFDMVERLFHVKSLRISLDFPTVSGSIEFYIRVACIV
ncbi:hypothetical protein Ddye_029174 [Dipteronia dyeriana]|uniref:F-box domain-containing protein n=1 Tax=Dipteronia dyeriana TaxID=168575 RepID=A0AAD9WL92_9ROSI|nr:hypothetical protein Ddye_029174 [Dipteronia dyeriana]